MPLYMARIAIKRHISVVLSALCLQIFVSYAAPKAVLLVAVFLLQLYQRLTVSGVFGLQSALLPQSYYMVVFCPQLTEQTERATAQRVVVAVAAVGKEHGHGGVDDEQIERRVGNALAVLNARAAEGVVSLPVRRNPGAQQVFKLLDGCTLGKAAKVALAR